MNIHLSAECFSELPGLQILQAAFPNRFSSGGDPVSFEMGFHSDGFSIERQADGFRINYRRPCDAFRALGLLLSGCNISEAGPISQLCSMESLGVMLDVSRNGVLKVESLEALFRSFALMGINTVQLYMEDVYELPEEPFFGYGRGAYSPNELRRIDDYGHLLGIEVVPCIQTLGHMEQVLQWPAYEEMADVRGVLLAGDDRTYQLIGKMLDLAASCFRTRRIHIGMDEAHGVGTGKYLTKNGFERSFDILNKHLEKVTGLCHARGLEPMIWSDMYFRIGSKTHDYYDEAAIIPAEVIGEISSNVELVYWDYYHADTTFYERWIDRHRLMGKEPIFAAGAWSWGRFWAYWPRIRETLDAGMKAARTRNLRQSFITVWGDDGAECHPFSFLMGIQYFAEWAYVGKPDMQALEMQFSVISGGSGALSDCILASEIDEIPITKDRLEGEANFAKWILWHDPVLGFLDRHIPNDLPAHYRLLSQKLLERASENSQLRFPATIAKALAVKTELHLEVRAAYHAKDTEQIQSLISEALPETLRTIQQLRSLHRQVWNVWYKPFGWEVLDRRYGGLIARLESLKDLLLEFLENPDGEIAEFEFGQNLVYPPEQNEKVYFSYARVVTPSAIK